MGTEVGGIKEQRDNEKVFNVTGLFVRQENRVRYNQQYYKDVFNDPDSIKLLDESVMQPSLLQLIEVHHSAFISHDRWSCPHLSWYIVEVARADARTGGR
mgnify:CR=1 FL=1